MSRPSFFTQRRDRLKTTNFDVKPVIRDVQKRFRLTATDIRYVSPLIRQDNSDLLLIYDRFGGPEAAYSDSLWRDIADQRVAFEARIATKLTQRQATAVRSARASLERRVIGRVLDDFTEGLIGELELDDLQTEAVTHIFRKDSDSKLDLIVRYNRRPEILDRELDRTTRETENLLSKILSPEQMRLYRSLSLPAERLLARL